MNILSLLGIETWSLRNSSTAYCYYALKHQGNEVGYLFFTENESELKAEKTALLLTSILQSINLTLAAHVGESLLDELAISTAKLIIIIGHDSEKLITQLHQPRTPIIKITDLTALLSSANEKKQLWLDIRKYQAIH